jgi:hypothetical protein
VCPCGKNRKFSLPHKITSTYIASQILESIGNPRIQLQPWLHKLTKKRDQGVAIEGLKLRNLAKLSDYITYPEMHLFDIKSAYQRMGIDLPKMRLCISTVTSISARSAQLPPTTIRARLQSALGLLLTFAIILNTLLRTFEPKNLYLVQESALLSDEIVALAEDAAQYRPLGSSAMPICLIAAWASTYDLQIRSKVEKVIEVYQSDFPISKWMDTARWLERRLRIHGLMPPNVQETKKMAVEECCVM